MSTEKLKRWRMILGGGDSNSDGTEVSLEGDDLQVDKTLSALYGSAKDQKGGLGKSSPNVARWLGDIRTYFPNSVVKVMQKDAMERLNLQALLLEPELLETVEADVHLVATLLTLSKVIPDKTKDTAKQVVSSVVQSLLKKLEQPMRQAVTGSLNKASKNRRPKYKEIDWNTTIRKNLKNYQAEYKTVIPEIQIGYGRKRNSLKHVVLCLDQSGSMGTSVVYSGIFGSVMASLPSVKTKMVVFDTAVVDLTEDLKDPVDLLFGVQLGGGTDINKALGYCQQIMERPSDTILILITDLYEGGNQNDMRIKMKEIVDSGVQLITLLALNDDGHPSFDRGNASYLGSLGVPVFSCTPDMFPDLMAAALTKQNIEMWAATNDVPIAGSDTFR